MSLPFHWGADSQPGARQLFSWDHQFHHWVVHYKRRKRRKKGNERRKLQQQRAYPPAPSSLGGATTSPLRTLNAVVSTLTGVRSTAPWPPRSGFSEILLHSVGGGKQKKVGRINFRSVGCAYSNSKLTFNLVRMDDGCLLEEEVLTHWFCSSFLIMISMIMLISSYDISVLRISLQMRRASMGWPPPPLLLSVEPRKLEFDSTKDRMRLK